MRLPLRQQCDPNGVPSTLGAAALRAGMTTAVAVLPQAWAGPTERQSASTHTPLRRGRRTHSRLPWFGFALAWESKRAVRSQFN